MRGPLHGMSNGAISSRVTGMTYFAWLLSMSGSLARYAWPVTFVLFGALAISLYPQARTASGLSAVPWARLAIGFLFPLAILLCGTFWHATGAPQWKPHPSAKLITWAIFGLLGTHILSVALTAHGAGGAKWVVAAAGACQVWWSLGSAFVALMSVTGDWL
jgi:hypothetical protein